MRRVCFTLQVLPERIEEYRARHAEVWPEMLTALTAAGWKDYALFLREDGLLVGHFRTDDLDAALAAMEATEVNRRWQREMAPFFAGLEGGRPDRALHPLREVFDLDAQLAALPRTEGADPGRGGDGPTREPSDHHEG